jgi:hypothetical protein
MQGLIFMDITNFGKMNRICTAVRDFQPEEWTWKKYILK